MTSELIDDQNPNYVVDDFDIEDNLKYINPSVPSIDSPVDRFHACKNACKVDGLVLEMGVFNGSSLFSIRDVFGGTVYGFDSWQGLPEDADDVPKGIGSFGKGNFKTDKIPVGEGIVLVDGWFKDSLPIFAQSHSEPIKFLHIDSDNYNSAKDVFDNLGHLIISGTVILFDEFKTYTGWRLREYRAFKKYIKSTSFNYEYILKTHNNERVALRII
jgi:hypothetical protein